MNNRKVICGLAVLTTAVYAIWRIGWTLPFGFRKIDMFFAILLLVAELVGFCEAVSYISFRNTGKTYRIPTLPTKDYPDVDIFIVTYNEGVQLLEKTVNGCLNMDYPDKAKVHIYICDDNDRKEMKELADRMHVGYFRRDTHKGAKAGNLNHALRNTSSPYVATFDADMIPMRDFLTTVIPYFFKNSNTKVNNENNKKIEKDNRKVGFVQTPQSFYNLDLFQYNLYAERDVPNEQEFFFKFIQGTRNQLNASIFAGSNTVLSREALNEIGGFYEKSITEDIATGFKIQAKGYETIALSEAHANGMAPTDLLSLFKQRDRWARGCIQTFRQLHIFTHKGMSLKQRFAYFSSLLYWYTPIRRLIFICSPILFSVFHIHLLDCTLLQILVIWLPHYICYSLALIKMSSRQRTPRLSNIYDTILFWYLIPGIILETFGIKKKEFSVTKKASAGSTEKKKNVIYLALPQIILFLFSFIGFVICFIHTVYNGTLEYSIILFWLAVNMYNLFMAIMFMLGRKHTRKADRFHSHIFADIYVDKDCISVESRDISEGGFSFWSEKPIYIPTDQDMIMRLQDEEERYAAVVQGRIVHVDKIKNSWCYSLEFTPVSDENRLRLYNILYDRLPTLPTEVHPRSGYFEDLKNNLKYRRKEPLDSNRKYARVTLNKRMETDKGFSVTAINYNYVCILIRCRKEYTEKNLKIYYNKNSYFECSLKKELGGHNVTHNLIYSIDNFEVTAVDSYLTEQLYQWEKEAEAKELEKKERMKQRLRQSQYEFDERAVL